MEEVKNAIKFEISELHNTPEPELMLTELYHKVSLLTELYHKVSYTADGALSQGELLLTELYHKVSFC